MIIAMKNPIERNISAYFENIDKQKLINFDVNE